jgi:Protein of unknown function (DUF3489)
MSDHTTGDMGGSRRNVSAHPSPQVHLLVDSMKATDWQAHSVRGFLSTAAKKHALKIESTKTEAGDRVYQIKK